VGILYYTKEKLQWEFKYPSEVVNCSSAGDDLRRIYYEKIQG